MAPITNRLPPRASATEISCDAGAICSSAGTSCSVVAAPVSRRLSGCAPSDEVAAAAARRSLRGREPASGCPPLCVLVVGVRREASGDQRWVPLAFNSSWLILPGCWWGHWCWTLLWGEWWCSNRFGLVLALFGDSACSRVVRAEVQLTASLSPCGLKSVAEVVSSTAVGTDCGSGQQVAPTGWAALSSRRLLA